MPRVFAPEQAHKFNQGAIEFMNGVAALPANVSSRITAALTAAGYTVDTSKNLMTAIDKLPLAEVKEICDYLGITYLVADTKYQVVRKLEAGISALKLGSLTVASVAGTAQGDTKVTVTEALGEGNAHFYKTHATAAPAPLYGDYVDTGWKAITSGSDITATTGHKLTVVEATPAGFIVKSGNVAITSKA